MGVDDIRIVVDFFAHPKTVKLERCLGLEGVKALLLLWAWAEKHRSNGDLSRITVSFRRKCSEPKFAS